LYVTAKKVGIAILSLFAVATAIYVACVLNKSQASYQLAKDAYAATVKQQNDGQPSEFASASMRRLSDKSESASTVQSGH